MASFVPTFRSVFEVFEAKSFSALDLQFMSERHPGCTNEATLASPTFDRTAESSAAPVSHLEPRTYWEEVATTRWGKYTSRVAERTILEALDRTGDAGTALEVGCEGGRWSKLLSDLGWSIICTDVDRRALALCQERIPAARCIHVNPEDQALPCKPSSLGLILCVEVFPVIESDWFLREAHRTLTPGGLVVGVALNRWSLRGLLVRAMERRRDDTEKDHAHYTVPYPLLRWRLKEEGFTIRYERGYCWFPFSRESNSFLVPMFTRLEELLGLPRLRLLSPWVAFIAQKR
jgi:SAM-dependent methyltransferase